MKKYTALFAALTLVLALAGCGAETQTPMPGQSEQEEFTQNSTENVNETDGMTLLDSVFDTLSEGTDVTITLEQEGVRQSYPNTLDTYCSSDYHYLVRHFAVELEDIGGSENQSRRFMGA